MANKCLRCGMDEMVTVITNGEREVVFDRMCEIIARMEGTLQDYWVEAEEKISEPYTCEVTGEQSREVYRLTSYFGEQIAEEYIVKWDIADRLTLLRLKKEEFFKLKQKHEGNYLIHADFYIQETGEALQPIE